MSVLARLCRGLIVAAGCAVASAPVLAQSETPQEAAASVSGQKKHAAKPKVAGMSLERRHQVCLTFIKRHDLSCDPWVEPTCGADSGYFRPLECVRPRSQ